MKKNKFHFLIFAIVLFLFGCTNITKEIGQPLNYNPDHFNNETVHYSKVLDSYGPPTKLTKTPKGMAFIYEYLENSEYQLSFSAPSARYVKITLAKAVIDRESLVLFFNHDGNLISNDYREIKENPGTGASVQLVYNIEQVIDTSYLDEKPNEFSWGRRLLNPIPEMLNENQSLFTGENGFEQRGTPKNIGQRTLENSSRRKN